MKEHPIPQDVISYRFHIVGNMTLKQFLEIAAGVVLAAIMYKTGLPGIIKWPFVVFFAATGAGAAFVPIAERPLDHWIMTYFKIMFKPTKYFWKKTAVIPALFHYKPDENQANQQPFLNTVPIKRQQASEFVASIPDAKLAKNKSQEDAKVTQVLDYFQNQPKKVVAQPGLNQVKIKPNTDLVLPAKPAAGSQKPKASSSAVQLISTPTIAFSRNEGDQKDKKESVSMRQNIVYEAQAPVALELPPAQNPDQSQNDQKSMEVGVFNSDLPFPNPPTQPNTLVGMVLNQAGEMIPGAIVEIKNQAGQVERAVKSNALGQFFVTTPLKPATYTVNVEAENFSFESFVFATNNDYLPPLEIRALD